MELVYLWVEDYKNIKKQGFNFSPRFDCKYDENTNELTIDENEDYVSIFPDNINVTAIVGENGSGKSNLLDLIMELDGWARIYDSFFFITSDKKIYTVNFDNKINSSIEPNQIDRLSKERVSTKYISSISFLTLSPFINELDKLYSSSINVMSIFAKENYENNHFIFEHFYLNLIPKIPNILNDELLRELFNIEERPNYLIFKFNKVVENIFEDDVSKILNKSFKKDETPTSYIYQIDIKDKILLENIFDLFKKIENKKKENYKKIRDIDNTKVPNRIFNMKGKEVFDRVNAANDMKQNRLNREKESLEKEIEEIGTMKFYFAKEKESKNSFYFSTGEMVVLYYIEKLQTLNLEQKDLILLLDECELFLHPEWQKKLIVYLMKLFGRSEFKRQIILTSHSPFILSDLPKENVIFLEKGEQKYPFKDNQTFGANTHTLLSHGFFMKDGLMGEFAKGKIEEIKIFYELVKKIEEKNKPNRKKLYKKLHLKLKKQYIIKHNKFKHIQSIIGEPFLNTIMKNYLDELDILFYGKNQFLDKEIERLQALKDS